MLLTKHVSLSSVPFYSTVYQEVVCVKYGLSHMNDTCLIKKTAITTVYFIASRDLNKSLNCFWSRLINFVVVC
jgi:hypothetical protein